MPDDAPRPRPPPKNKSWTDQFRSAALVLLGSGAFVLFLRGMLLKFRGASITYQDIFILLFVSGVLLGVNFGLDVLDGPGGR